jgi:hypothetical protein
VELARLSGRVYDAAAIAIESRMKSKHLELMALYLEVLAWHQQIPDLFAFYPSTGHKGRPLRAHAFRNIVVFLRHQQLRSLIYQALLPSTKEGVVSVELVRNALELASSRIDTLHGLEEKFGFHQRESFVCQALPGWSLLSTITGRFVHQSWYSAKPKQSEHGIEGLHVG